MWKDIIITILCILLLFSNIAKDKCLNDNKNKIWKENLIHLKN